MSEPTQENAPVVVDQSGNPDISQSAAPAVASESESESSGPEPTELADGSVVEVARDTKLVNYSPNPAVEGETSVIPHSVTVTAPNGHRDTIETESADESSFYHKLIVTLDKLGFRRS